LLFRRNGCCACGRTFLFTQFCLAKTWILHVQNQIRVNRRWLSLLAW
jgi:hypothetical protein